MSNLTPFHTTSTKQPVTSSDTSVSGPLCEKIPSSIRGSLPHLKHSGFRFLQLPGEIRNRIYDLVIPRSHVLVMSDHPQKELNRLRKLYSSPRPARYRLCGRILSIDDEAADPMGLIRSCRAIRDESIRVFYSKTTPCFQSLSAINKFLNCAPLAGLRSIRSISLTVQSYGEPTLTKDCKWKEKKDRKWQDTCSRIAKLLVGLQTLHLDLKLATWPTTLSSDEDWTHPLMILKRNGLHLVRLTLRHHRFEETRLDMAARRLENNMMTADGREERDLQEALEAVREMETKAARPPKAKRVLVIKSTASESAHQKNGPKKTQKVGASSKSVFRTKGLAEYERIDLSTVGISFVQCTG